MRITTVLLAAVALSAGVAQAQYFNQPPAGFNGQIAGQAQFGAGGGVNAFGQAGVNQMPMMLQPGVAAVGIPNPQLQTVPYPPGVTGNPPAQAEGEVRADVTPMNLGCNGEVRGYSTAINSRGETIIRTGTH